MATFTRSQVKKACQQQPQKEQEGQEGKNQCCCMHEKACLLFRMSIGIGDHTLSGCQGTGGQETQGVGRGAEETNQGK